MQSVIRELFYAGLDKESFNAVRDDWLKENSRNLIIYSTITLAIFTILLIANVFTEDITSVNVKSYLIMAVYNGVLLTLALTAVRSRPSLSVPLAYALMIGLYAFALRITGLHRDMPAVIAVAMLFAAPFLFTDRPIRMITMTVAVVTSIIVVANCFKEPDVASMDKWNSIAVGAVTIPIEILQMRHKFFSFNQTRKINYLSETDILTGAKNRNLYEHSLKEYARKFRHSLTVVFVDVNCLHELNDAKGHAAGDAMLQAVARELIASFGESYVYRIGGDEFVVFRPDADEEAVNAEMARIAAVLSQQTYDISVGVATALKDGPTPTDLVSQAEQKMYVAKSLYYQQKGKDRRWRPPKPPTA